MATFGLEYFLATVALWAASVLHTFQARVRPVQAPVYAWKNRLGKVNRWLLLASPHKAAAATIVGTFVLNVGGLSIPVAGPYFVFFMALLMLVDVQRLKQGLSDVEKAYEHGPTSL